MTFVIVLFTWAFFRAPDLGSSLAYCAGMLGIGDIAASSALLAGVIYKPYYLLTFLLAGAVVWGAPQTWDFTRKISWGKVGWVAAVLVLSLLALSTQGFNPFIYFVF